MKQLTTISFFSYDTFFSRCWAFAFMGLGKRLLGNVKGLSFAKQLGTGAGAGFSFKPDFSRYAFLAVWDDEISAEAFFNHSDFIKKVNQYAKEGLTFKLVCTQTHGKWDGKIPFTPSKSNAEGPVAVITRATIRPGALLRFWKHVPLTSKAIEEADGLIYSAGVGEVPWVKQSTFSIWDSTEMMLDFAYKKIHKEVVVKTKNENWYNEDLFARFQIIGSEGMINGVNPLKDSENNFRFKA